MKIAITTVGTRGDLQPYIALGLGLQAAGHDVLLISAKNEEKFVRSYGLNFFALNVDIQELMEGGEVRGMSKGNNPLKFIVGHLRGSKKLKKLMAATQAGIWDGCQNADIIIFHPGMPIGFFIAKQLGKISVMANPFPVIATKDYPSILFYTSPRLGKIFNLVTHFIFEKLFWSLTKSAIKEFWEKTVKSKMDFTVSPIRQQINSGMPVLNGYSRHLFHPPKEWGKNIHTTGSWLLGNEPDFTPPAALINFIEKGTPAVYIGFGSMKDLDAFEAMFKIILKALEITKQRAVVAPGWSNMSYAGSIPIPENVFLIGSVAHSWLFPQMSIVIHHGGAGTTATGLTAGKPTIIIPHNADQPAWGQRVYELGAGPEPIKKTKLTADKLAKAILFALKPAIAANAEQLAQQLRKENGVSKAVSVINQYLYPGTEKVTLL